MPFSKVKTPPSSKSGVNRQTDKLTTVTLSRMRAEGNNMKIRVWTVLWTIIRKARNHCQDVDNCGDEDHCQYHLGIDHCQTGNCCQDREHCQNGNEHADR